ncbi:LLM class flavin-dependent oxidoreductase [Phytohabitans aurantiacus]|uniref:Monooxygenase n=1 Tax=Phytohabitans aurantiacus TaxID=3016789 RepID=A0ABQ5QW51_9ACTN|nr:LLM class flavin-dependent oxidoreductase [Phytohabitans aurantiacus]GLH98492.1 monooxygenase [Phytohabitans aurantiacus]
MDIGVGLPTTVPGTDGKHLLEFARRADELGFSTLAVIDRLVYDSYDSIVALAGAAAVTERIRLATTILLAAYRPGPAVLAKQLASLDRLCGGRLAIGLAAGGRPDDYEAAGVTYGRRGRRLDSMIDEMKAVWAGEGAVPGIGPRPTDGDIPIWIGGHSEAALRRAAKHAVGWIAPGGSVMGFPDLVRRARDVWAAENRTDTPRMAALTYVALGSQRKEQAGDYLRHYYSYVGPKAEMLAAHVIADEDRLRATIEGYAAAGCDELLIFPGTADAEQLPLLAKVAFG